MKQKEKQRCEKILAIKSPYCYCFKNNFYPFLFMSQIETVQDLLFWNIGLLKYRCYLFMKTLSAVALFYSAGIRFLLGPGSHMDHTARVLPDSEGALLEREHHRILELKLTLKISNPHHFVEKAASEKPNSLASWWQS